MNKTAYITPKTEIVKIDEQDILAGSPSFEDGEVNSGDAKRRTLEDESLDASTFGSLW